MASYPLWAFTDGRRIKVIRGSSQKVAMGQATRTWPEVGQTIRPMDVCEVTWAEQYSAHHHLDWLHREPAYEVYVRLMARTPRLQVVSTT
jgi:hypothetical protein